MTKQLLVLAVAGIGAVALSGCEIILPIIALVSNNDDPPTDDYYDDYYYDSYYGAVDVTIEQFSGSFYGRTLDMGMAPTVTGSQDYGSGYFALSVEGIPEGSEYEAPDAGPYIEPPSGDDLTVSLNVCPIEDLASGEVVSDPSAYAGLSICDASYNCLDGYNGNMQITVEDDAEGNRRIRATGTWSSGDTVSMTLAYVRPE